MSLRIAFVALLSLAPFVRAQTPEFRTPLLDAGYFPAFVAAGDLDGDGLPDLVTTGEATVFVTRQVAPGEFAAPVAAALQDFIDEPVLADLDLDGDLDVAAPVDIPTKHAMDFIGVLLGGGDGTLAGPVLLDTAQNPSDLAIADLDADGAPDLLAPGSATLRLSVFLGHGDGTFAPKSDLNVGIAPFKIDVGLADGDDDLDVVVISSSGTCKTLAGDGAGGLVEVATTEAGTNAREISVGDVDSDGHLDALVTYKNVTHYRVLLGDGAAGFVPQPYVLAPSTTLDGELADLDEDGDDDLVVLLDEVSQIPEWTGFLVQLSHGDGTFAAAVGYGTDQTPADLVVADLNRDGDLDLFATVPVTLFPQLTAMFLPGRGDGSFGPLLRTGDAPEEAVLADLDGDGVRELVVACGSDDAVAVHAGLGRGAFGAPVLTVMGQFPVAVVVGDVFEDGLPDVVVANRWNPGSVTARPGYGTLGFGAAVVSLPNDVPFSMAAGDVNLDGHLDLALGCNGYPQSARLLLGSGSGTFTTADSVLIGNGIPDACALGDLDADGWLDLVVAPTAPATVIRAMGDGSGLLGPPVGVTVPYYHQHDVALGDLDGDEDLDVVSSGGDAGGLNLLVNDGSGALAVAPGLPASKTWGVAITDFDGDGVADIMAAAEHHPTTAAFGALLAWRGLGGATFSAPVATTVAAITHELLVDDLDGDGAPDAMVFAIEDDDLWILLNPDGPWDDLGQPLAGVQGLPRQQGFGTLQSGQPFEILLTDGRPGGAAWHVVGLSAIDAPFKGGVMVPVPLLITGPWPLDPQGDLSLAGPWPGPASSGLALHVQFWMQDPAGVKGWSATNALRGALP
jgi:hypothetical protein